MRKFAPYLQRFFGFIDLLVRIIRKTNQNYV